MSPALIALFIAAFAFGTTEFVIAGVLPQVADGLDISVPTAGYLVSGDHFRFLVEHDGLAFPEAVERMAELAGVPMPERDPEAEKRDEQRATLQDVMEMATKFFEEQLQAGSGAYFGVAMVVAVGLVPEAQRGRAVAVVLAGLTVSNVVGVPVGAAIGGMFGCARPSGRCSRSASPRSPRSPC
jgi:DHA1 family inner membrane transport protein